MSLCEPIELPHGTVTSLLYAIAKQRESIADKISQKKYTISRNIYARFITLTVNVTIFIYLKSLDKHQLEDRPERFMKHLNHL